MQRAAAVIIQEEKVLLLFRKAHGRQYFCLPGGRMERGEIPEQTVIREIKEETSLDIELEGLLMEYDGIYDHEYVFVAKNIHGEAKLGGIELERNSEDNYYEIAWINLKDLPKTSLLPEIAKQKILERFVA